MCENGKLSAREICRIAYGTTKNFMTPRIKSYGLLAPNVAYEISEGEGFLTGNRLFGFSVVEWLPSFGITAKLNGLSKSFQSYTMLTIWRDTIKQSPGLIEQERAKFDEYICGHGKNRWHHPDCWLYYMTGDAKYWQRAKEKYDEI